MSTQPAVITDQAGVNSAGSYDQAAESILDFDPQAPILSESSSETETAVADDAVAGTGDKTTAEVDGAVAASAAVKTGDAEVKTEQTQADEWAIDHVLLDKAIADPVHGTIVKALHEKYQKLGGYREHWTLEEAREAHALAPGGFAELKSVVEEGRAAKLENAEFMSADPARQSVVLKQMAAEMPEAFAAGAKPFLDTLHATSPQTYDKIALELATEGLKLDGVPEILSSLFKAVDDNDEKAFPEAMQQLRDWVAETSKNVPDLFKAAAPAKKDAPLSPEIQKALDENKAYKAREHEQVTKGFFDWKKGLDDTFEKSVTADISSKVDLVVPKNMPTAAREGLVTRLQREIFSEVQKRVNSDTDLGANISKLISNNAWRDKGEEIKTQAHNLFYGRAKQLLPHVAREILNPFAEGVVASNKARVDKENETSGRKEVPGAAAVSGQRTPLNLKEAEKKAGRRLTEEEILDL